MCQEIAMKNVGVAINFSHALMAGENPAESIAFLNRAGKLFQVYMSDSYNMWDDMMVPGSLHLWETLEALFYLKTIKHRGFVTLDVIPQRIDPTHSLQIAIGNLAIAGCCPLLAIFGDSRLDLHVNILIIARR